LAPGLNVVTAAIEFGTDYSIIVSDDSGCTASVFQVFEPCNILPIELISFEGEVLNEGNYLKWQTATEIDNDFFTLERSDNEGNDWIEIANVPGAGSTTIVQNYNFLDKYPPPGLSLYKLIQTDFDGTSTEVGIVELFRSSESILIYSVVYDPATELVDININSNLQTTADILVINMIGQQMLRFAEELNYNFNQLQYDVSALPSGLYVIRIQAADWSEHVKFYKP